ncbi:aromatic ring-hydroxylating dioxygenase subunit alpha [Actinomadura sp. 6N118]|uniref:aromatic ring-hydroxylating dioxygenase subunit alpha n=1 Tax=Actinomadura sp. 6N118 TaxID=3375151 RepID=UPI00378F678F
MTTPTYVPGTELDGAAHEDALRVMERLVRHYRDKTTDLADGQWREPVRNYADPDLFRAEIEQVHRRIPLPLALSCELPGPHSYKAIEAAGIPVVITRDGDGRAHAMVNACRHRGAEIVGAGTGSARHLTCPYHAWSYDLRGCLTGVYGEKTFGSVDRAERSLIALPVEERAGIIFVCLTPGLDLDLDAWLGDALPLLEALRLETRHHHSTRLIKGPNWKVVVDGYLEGYHFASLHRTTVFKTNLSNMAAFDAYGPHQRNVFALRPIAEAVSRPSEEWDPATCTGPILWFFPGLAIAGGLRHQTAVSLVFPGRHVGESHTHQLFLLNEPPSSEEEIKSADQARDWFHDVVLDEDYLTGEGVQRGMEALSGTDYVFGRNEPGVQHFHRALNGLMESR